MSFFSYELSSSAGKIALSLFLISIGQFIFTLIFVYVWSYCRDVRVASTRDVLRLSELNVEPEAKKRNWITLLPSSSWVIMTTLWIIVIKLLQLPTAPLSVEKICIKIVLLPLNLGLLILIFRVIDYISPFVNKKKARDSVHRHFYPLFRKNVKGVVSICVLLVYLQQLDVPIISIIGGLGVLGLGLGLASQNMIQNLFGALLIVYDGLFNSGDWIIVQTQSGPIEGVVEEIGYRTTKIRQFDQRLTYIPNATFTVYPMDNLQSSKQARIKFTVSVSAQANGPTLENFSEKVRENLKNHKGLASNPLFYLLSADSAGLNYEVYCFLDSGPAQDVSKNWEWWYLWLQCREDIMVMIFNTANHFGLSISIPTQSLKFSGNLSEISTRMGESSSDSRTSSFSSGLQRRHTQEERKEAPVPEKDLVFFDKFE